MVVIVKFNYWFQFSISADGNCLYNAASIALTGSEKLSPYLRRLCSIELYENAACYSDHPVIKSQHDNGAFTSIKNAFAMCLSNSALSKFEKHDAIAAIIEEGKGNSINYTFSSMMCMFALATVTECTIESYFPISGEAAGRDGRDSLAKMYNCTINPRVGENGEKIHIFRCASMPRHFMIDRKMPETRNNFVALCQPVKPTEPGQQHFVPKLISSRLPSTGCPQCTTSTSSTTAATSSSVTSPLTPSTPTSSSSVPQEVSKNRKRKQLSLDNLFSKKRIEDARLVKDTSVKSDITNPPTANTHLAIKQATEAVETVQFPPKDLTDLVNKGSHPYDINNFVNRATGLSDSEKYDILCKVWKPEKDYVFACNDKSRRRFRYEWLNSFPWLCYSADVDGGFCLNCVLFGDENSKLQRLFKSPLHPTTSYVKKLEDHAGKSSIHKISTVRALHFKQVMENKMIGIDAQINHARLELIEKNRVRLRPIIGAIFTCARQNIPLRGHRDDVHYHLGDDQTNPGNFIEILKFGASCGNLTDVLFNTSPSNQTYRSKTFQNEIIEICGDMITERLVDDVKRAKFFFLFWRMRQRIVQTLDRWLWC